MSWRTHIDARERRLLLLLGAASFFNQYDQGLLSLLLVQIQTDLAIPEAQLGLLGSAVRLGGLAACGALLLADRWGRRRLLLATIAGYTLLTAATALAPSFEALVVFQFLARAFMTAELLLSMVVVVEEFRPHNRGIGIGLLGTLALLGRGLAMILFGSVEYVPFGWRGLYALGILPLLLVTCFRRCLVETRRFSDDCAARGAPREWLRPLRLLLRTRPWRLVAVVCVGFLWSFSNSPVDFFLPKYFQEVHGWAPARFATVAVCGGALGLTGQLVAGWLSDRRGRRPTLVLVLLLEPLTGIALYSLLGPAVIGLFALWVFVSVSADVAGETSARELFPTSARATAAGLGAVAATLGGVAGLACEAILFGVLGSHWLAVRVLAATGLLMPWIVWAAYPETSGRQLEEIAPEPESIPAASRSGESDAVEPARARG